MKRILLIIFVIMVVTDLHGQSQPKSNTPTYLSVGSNVGSVFKTNDFFRGDYAIPIYSMYSLKYIFLPTGDHWRHIAHGMPYYGIGVSATDFGRPDDLGSPFSLYLLQGATIKNFYTSKNRALFALNYELNLGLSTNWIPYNPFDNPDNRAIGSILNAHVGINLYTKWYLSESLDLHVGGELLHFSNGTSRQPNSGLNAVSGYFELAYNFNRNQIKDRYDPTLKVPEMDPHIEHDIQFIISSKSIKIDTTGTGLADIYPERQFNVFGANYYTMVVPNYKHKYGIGAELLYDESSNVKIYQKYHTLDKRYYNITELANLEERLSLGISVRGELVMPLYSLFANFGYNLIHTDKATKRFYQTMGIKVGLKDNLYGTFGIRANHFSKAQFLYWSLGYTIKKKNR